MISVRGEYFIRCVDCRRFLSTGRSRFNAKRAAATHVDKTHHTVEVFDDTELIDVYRWDHPMLAIDHESVRGPLLLQRRDPQKAFRDSIARANETVRMTGNAEIDAYITKRRAMGDGGSHVQGRGKTQQLDQERD